MGNCQECCGEELNEKIEQNMNKNDTKKLHFKAGVNEINRQEAQTIKEADERKSIVSQSFVSDNLNRSNAYHIGGKVINVENKSENPKNYKDGNRRAFPPIEIDAGLRTYEGEWVNGKRDGFGIIRERDGTTLKGTFSQGVLNGFGHHVFSNGDEFMGYFQNNVKQGWGKHYSKKNNLYRVGLYTSDKMVSFLYEVSNTYIYVGECNDGGKEGIGMLTTDTIVYQGEFLKNNVTGISLLKTAENKVTAGEFVEQKLNGYGFSVQENKYTECEYVEDAKKGFCLILKDGKAYCGTADGDFQGELLYFDGKKYSNYLYSGKNKEKLTKPIKFYSIAKEAIDDSINEFERLKSQFYYPFNDALSGVNVNDHFNNVKYMN